MCVICASSFVTDFLQLVFQSAVSCFYLWWRSAWCTSWTWMLALRLCELMRCFLAVVKLTVAFSFLLFFRTVFRFFAGSSTHACSLTLFIGTLLQLFFPFWLLLFLFAVFCLTLLLLQLVVFHLTWLHLTSLVYLWLFCFSVVCLVFSLVLYLTSLVSTCECFACSVAFCWCAAVRFLLLAAFAS